MTASNEQRARLRRGKGPPQEGCAHLRKEGADHQEGGHLRRRDHVRADGGLRLQQRGLRRRKALTGSPVGFGLNGFWPVSCVLRRLLGQCPEVLTMVVKGVKVFADVHCAYSALWDVSL